MPIYVYRCESCNKTHEVFQHINDDPVQECPSCGGHVHKVIAPCGVIFKGHGFYKTDNASNSVGTRSDSTEKSSPATETAVNSESKKAEEPKPAPSAGAAKPAEHK